MRRRAPHKPEAFAGLHLEQPLNLQLRFGSAGERGPEMKDGLSRRLSPFEGGLDEHESRTPQNPVHQKEILETVRVYRRNTAPFHSRLLPARGYAAARDKLEHNNCLASSKFDSAPHYYGRTLFHNGNFATVTSVA